MKENKITFNPILNEMVKSAQRRKSENGRYAFVGFILGMFVGIVLCVIIGVIT